VAQQRTTCLWAGADLIRGQLNGPPGGRWIPPAQKLSISFFLKNNVPAEWWTTKPKTGAPLQWASRFRLALESILATTSELTIIGKPDGCLFL